MTRIVLHLLAIALLTAATQLGGIAYAVAWLASKSRTTFVAIFLAAYAALSVTAVYTAPLAGRVPLPCMTSGEIPLRMQSPLYCVLNRNYVTPQMATIAKGLARHMDDRFPGTVTLTLDANLPFLDGFPLVPHLSHADGRKLDFAFYYADLNGDYSPGRTRSPIGYWAFEEPAAGQQAACRDKKRLLTLRWDMAWFQPFTRDMRLDTGRTAEGLRWLSGEGQALGLEKILLEPHLANSLGAKSDIVRFQGCRAARHDDHIHVQL